MIKKILLIIFSLLLFTIIGFAQTGTYTTNGYFYLPSYGEAGADAFDEYNLYMQIADTQIEANKTNSFATIDTEAELEVALTDVTNVYTNNDYTYTDYLLVANKYTDAEAVAAIKADEDWNATNWDLAYGWGDHSLEGYLTIVAFDDLSDVDLTGIADGKIVKYDLATTTWVIADDDNTTYTSSDFTHDDLTGVTANEHIDWTTSQAPTVIHADNYTDTDTTYTAGTGLSLLGTEFSSTITQYADADAIAAIKGDAAWKATDWDTAYGWGNHSTQGYLKNITNENFASLKDIPAHPAANNKILETVADGTYKYIDTPSGGAGATTYLDLTDTPAAYDNGKYAKSTAAGVVWDTPTGSGDMLKSTYDADADGDIDVAAGGTEKSSWTQYCIPYLSGTTAFGEIAIGTAAQLLKVNATANGYEWFTPSYLTDITGQTFASLSDIPAHPGVANKILETTAGGYIYIDTPSGGGGGYDNLTDFIDQTAWRLFYSDASGDVTELALGTVGQYLKSQGATSAPTWDTPAGGGDVTNWIIPQDYATGSGTSGDPWAGDCIDDAITAASAGDTIYCRAGYYQLGGICSVSKAVNIIGEGIGKTIILGDAVEQGFLVSEVDHVTFKDFTLDGDDLTGTNPYCFQISTSDYTVLENIEAKNAGKIGINIVNSNHCYLNNIYAHDNGEHGIHIGASVGNDSDYNVLENLYLYNNTGSGLDAYSVAESAVYAEYNIYQNVMTWDNGQGIAIWGEKHSILNNASAYSNTTHGYYLFYLEDCQINNCISILNGSSGATIYAQSVNFDNFTVKNNGTGIVAYASDELIFTNCQIYDDDAGTTQDYAFQFHEYESDACEGIRIDNCKITDNAEGTIADVDSSATYTVNGVSDGEQAAAGDIQYFNGTNWVLLTKDSGKYLKSGDAAVSWDTPAGGGASQLSDLSDVNTSTPTNKYVLVADGVDFESRQLTSDDLSDVSSIAMLDENELVTGNWTYNASYEYLIRKHDTSPFILGFHRKRDGDPTSNVSNNDVLGNIKFYGYYWDYYEAAYIQAAIDNTPGGADMPGRLDFYTTADGASSGSLRMTIDSAGNLKYGDGVWTNYVNITNAGVLTLEGTANIEGCDATEFGYLDGVTSDIQEQLNNKIEVSAALSGDHSYSGIIDSQAVGESVVFGNLLYFNWTDKEWKLAKADAAATTPALAIALESKTDGQTCKLLRQGYIRDDTWNFTAAMVYLSDTTAGSVLSAAPSDSGDQVQRVGQAKSADIMYFNPSIDVGEI